MRILVALFIVLALTATAQPNETERREGDERFEVRITDEMLRHSRLRHVLYFVGVAWSIGVLALVLMTGLSRRMRDAAARVAKRPFVIALIYCALFLLVTTLLQFPLAYYSGFVVPHQFDLSDQSFLSWMGDFAKAVAVSLVIGSLVGAFALLGIRKVRNWWALLWAASVPLTVFVIVVQPIVLDPLFNKFEPLQDHVLRQKLIDLAAKAGIEGGRVYQVNKSKQTKTMNAYVNGIGPTTRIVMWDTLLAKMDHDEVLAVMGHEMGHYVLKHIPKGVAFSVAVSFVGFFLVQRIYDRLRPRWGFAPGDPASVPLLLLIASVLTFLFSPVASAYSRSVEHEADMFGLEVTHLNEASATSFRKMAEDSKVDPSPPAFIKFWRYSHPPIAERIPFALSYRPWERGEPNRVWKAE